MENALRAMKNVNGKAKKSSYKKGGKREMPKVMDCKNVKVKKNEREEKVNWP